MDAALELLTAIPTDRTEPGAGLAVLLADFVGCALAAQNGPPLSAFAADGASGAAAALALRASGADRDDVDWRSLHHPGSVVWPVALAVAGEVGASGDQLTAAAQHGYSVAATMADLLGPRHRRVWHVTATAGALAAAATASVLLGSDRRTRQVALALAAANCGGLASAVLERRGAGAFNRSAAAMLGLASARSAAAGATGMLRPISGAGGVLEAMSGGEDVTAVSVRDGLTDAAPRFLPISGFLQSAVVGTAAARGMLAGNLTSLRIGLAPGTLALVGDSSAGPWWDAREGVVRAWIAGDPFRVDRTRGTEELAGVVALEPEDVGVGHAIVRVVTDRGSLDLVVGPWSAQDPDAADRIGRKWADLPNGRGIGLLDLAARTLAPDGSVDDLMNELRR